MKKILKYLINLINKVYLFVYRKNYKLSNSFIYFLRLNISDTSSLYAKKSKLEKCRVFIEGRKNQLVCRGSILKDCDLRIKGNNNIITFNNSCVLRKVEIQLRGENCVVEIGKKTTTNGARMINVGHSNSIKIGENCMLSDKIEIWASDTHKIYDDNNNWINVEKSVRIGDNVWVGSNVTILKGVNIGNGSVLGMGSMITKDVPNKSIVVGHNRVIEENITWDLEYC